MTTQLRPGFNDTSELWELNYKRLDRFVKKIVPFFRVEALDRCIDVGESNPKMELIKRKMGFEADQLVVDDLNFARLDGHGKYDVIFALDLLEHLQNPLWFMNEIKGMLNPRGRIYLMVPCNWRWLWMEGHYFELDHAHLEKWIVRPLEMRIARSQRIRFMMDWRAIWIGVRPLVKYLKGRRSAVSLVRGFLYTKWELYEIEK